MGTLLPATFQSGGQVSQHFIPGAYSRIDFVKSAGGLSPMNNPVIGGDCRGGEPNKLLTFGSLSEATAVLISGPLLDSIMHAFDPGPDYTPQQISAWRVNPGLQAIKSLVQTQAGVVAKVELTITTGVSATGADNVAVILDGDTAVLVAVANNDTTAQVATKVRAGTYPGWACTGTGSHIIFTKSAAGALSGGANTFSSGTTGVLATLGMVLLNNGRTAGTPSILGATAWDWSLYTNQLKIKLEAGTLVGKKLTVSFMAQTAFVVDNILRQSIRIQYTGNEAACALNINELGLNTVTTGGTQELNLLFSSFPKIQDLVNFINDQAGYACTVLTLNPNTELTTQLDSLDEQDIKSTAYEMTSNVQALVDAFNSCAWIDTAVFNSGNGRYMPDNITSWAYFTGGTDGAYTSSEWTTALTALQKENIQLIGASSEDAGIHALIAQHCQAMNAVTGKSERQFILGGAINETVAQFITRCQNLNTNAGALVYPDFQAYDNTNTAIQWWSPAYYAAKLLGMATCLALNEPMTNKQVAVMGFRTVSTSDVQKCIQNGGTVGWRNSVGQFITVRMINTYQGGDLQQAEFSMMREALFVNRDLRNAVEATFIGRAMTNGLLADVDVTVHLKLNQYVGLGLFNGDTPYWGYKKRVNGDQIIIEFNCYLTPPTNFIFITSHMSVYASAAAA
jgi:hypothetical protein